MCHCVNIGHLFLLMMEADNGDDKYPYYFEDLSSADDALVKAHFLSNSKKRDLGRTIG